MLLGRAIGVEVRVFAALIVGVSVSGTRGIRVDVGRFVGCDRAIGVSVGSTKSKTCCSGSPCVRWVSVLLIVSINDC